MKKIKKVIITGGPEGQLALIRQLRRQDHTASITLLNPEPEAFLSDVGLRNLYQNNSEHLFQEIEETKARVSKEYQTEILYDRKILSIDLDPRSVVVSRKGQMERMPFDSLLSSGKAVFLKPGFDGADLVTFCHSFSDIVAIKKAVHKKDFSMLIVGANERAIELALLLNNDHVKVTIIDSSKRFLPMYSLFTANDMKRKLEQEGIRVIGGQPIKKLEQFDNQAICTLNDGSEFYFDGTISTECRFAHPILERAQILLSPLGNVEVDDTLATDLPSVFAVGKGLVLKTLSAAEYVLPAGDMAIFKTALIASKNALDNSLSNKERIAPLAEVKAQTIGDFNYARVGFDEVAAKNKMCDIVFVVTHFHGDHDGFTRLVLNKEDQRIMGAEIKSRLDVKNAINLISFAIQTSLTIQQLKNLDCLLDENIIYLMEALDKAQSCADTVVTSDDVASWIMQNKEFSLLDVSQDRKAPDELWCSIDDLEKNLAAIKTQRMPIVLTCEDGEKSIKAHQTLTAFGIYDVFVLDGGRKSLEFLMFSS